VEGVEEVAEMEVQPSEAGLYWAPVLRAVVPFHPPQTIISEPVHTAECWVRAEGQFEPVDVAVHMSETGL
jgi:hypothetical protein